MGVVAILIGIPLFVVFGALAIQEDEKKSVKMGFVYLSIILGVLTVSGITMDLKADYKIEKEEITTNKLETDKNETIKLDEPTKIIITTKKYPWYTELKSDRKTYQIKE